MKVDRQVESNGREVVQNFIYKLEGTESVNQIGPIVLRTTATWNDAALELSSEFFADEKKIGELSEVYRLVNGELVIDSTRQTSAGTLKANTVHRKR
jgi:hypothetical protein